MKTPAYAITLAFALATFAGSADAQAPRTAPGKPLALTQQPAANKAVRAPARVATHRTVIRKKVVVTFPKKIVPIQLALNPGERGVLYRTLTTPARRVVYTRPAAVVAAPVVAAAPRYYA